MSTTVTALDFWNAHEVKEIFVAGIGNSGCIYEQDLDGNLKKLVESGLFNSDAEIQDFWKAQGEVSEDGKSWWWDGIPNLRDSKGNYYCSISLLA